MRILCEYRAHNKKHMRVSWGIKSFCFKGMRDYAHAENAYAPGWRGRAMCFLKGPKMRKTELLTTPELARLLKLQPETVRRLVRRGQIPSIRLSPKIVRYDADAVMRAMRQLSGENMTCWPGTRSPTQDAGGSKQYREHDKLADQERRNGT